MGHLDEQQCPMMAKVAQNILKGPIWKGLRGDDPAGWFCTNGLILLAGPSSYQLTGDY